MNITFKRTAGTALNFAVVIIAVFALVNPASREGSYETLKIGVLCFLLLVLGFTSIRNLNRRLDLEKKRTQELQDQNLKSSVLILELDTKTRREISTWLHGEVQGKLMSLARKLKTQGSDEAASEISNLCDQTIRAMAHQLHPHQIEISLQLALSDLCSGRAELQLSENLRLQTFSHSNNLFIPTELRVAIYRIVEEGINNARKKPNTQNVLASVVAQHNRIDISVRDDGDELIDHPTSSLGFSLISLFVDKYRGNWSIYNENDGVVLKASLFESMKSSHDYISEHFSHLPQGRDVKTK
jgi:glucose-6-phosphate-specific signal transduction histidine kinase